MHSTSSATASPVAPALYSSMPAAPAAPCSLRRLTLEEFVANLAKQAIVVPDSYTNSDIEAFATPIAADEQIVTWIFASETWRNLSPRIEALIAGGRFSSPKSKIMALAKSAYHLSLSNGITKDYYTQTIRDFARFEEAVQQPYLERCLKETEEVIGLLHNNAPNAKAELYALKGKLTLVDTLRGFYLDPLVSVRIKELADFLINNPEDELDYAPELYNAIERLIVTAQSKRTLIMQVCMQPGRLFQPERAWNKAQAPLLAQIAVPANPLYTEFYLPHSKAILEGAFVFLQKLLIKEIRQLVPHPRKTKKPLKEALSHTLDLMRQESADAIPSWKKLIQESERELSERINTLFLTHFWGKFFSDRPDFDIEAFAWGIVQKLPPIVIKDVHECLLEKDKAQNKKIYSIEFKDRPAVVRDFDAQRADVAYKRLFLCIEVQNLSFATLIL